MAVHNGGLIGKLLELGSDSDPDEHVENEEVLPDDIFDDDKGNNSTPDPLTKNSRPLSKMRAIEEYLEQKQLQQWLQDPLDDYGS